jgi:hypothetical protein
MRNAHFLAESAGTPPRREILRDHPFQQGQAVQPIMADIELRSIASCSHIFPALKISFLQHEDEKSAKDNKNTP